MRKRLYAYATGKEKHPDIKFIMIVDDPKKVENCTKVFINKYKFKNKQELYKIDYDILKSLVFDCANLAQSIDDKIINKNEYDTYVVYDEFEENEFLDLDDNVIGYEKIPKKPSKITTKKPSKITTKKPSKIITKKPSKIKTKKPSKKSSKKPSKKSSKKPSKITTKNNLKLQQKNNLKNHQ